MTSALDYQDRAWLGGPSLGASRLCDDPSDAAAGSEPYLGGVLVVLPGQPRWDRPTLRGGVLGSDEPARLGCV
jgi:hypothetical protein